MHITNEEMATERRKYDVDKDKKILLNIPITGKQEFQQKPLSRGSRNSLLKSKYDNDLDQHLSKLSLYDDDSSSSSDEEERRKLEEILVPKCPDKIKDLKKAEKRSNLRPYQPPQHLVSPGLQSGGGLIPNYLYRIPQSVPVPQITAPVEDYDSSNEVYDGKEIITIMQNLSPEQMSVLNTAIDMAKDEQETNIPSQLTTRVRDFDTCNSPDSSYGTMSPVSVPPSPFSTIHSPNPRLEMQRLSESDSSSGDIELGLTELPFMNLETKHPQQIKMNFICVQPPPPALAIRSSNCIQQPIQKTLNYLPMQGTYHQRPLKPDSIDVNEFGIEKLAKIRMKEKKLIKGSVVQNEWVIAIQEATPLFDAKLKPEEHKQAIKVLRKKLIDLIYEGPNKKSYYYEKLYTKVSLYGKHFPEILTGADESGKSPLIVAALDCNDTPLVARLIADNLEKVSKTSQESLDKQGNSLLHYLAEKGDSHVEVLCELLNSKVFNIDHINVGSNSPLHKAVETHATKSSLASVKQFIKNGASIKTRDLYGKTVLHLAVKYPQSDPQLLRALLMSNMADKAVNIFDIDRNTPLHIAASRNDLPFERQKDFIKLLIIYKAKHDMRNKDEKVPLALVAPERKEYIRSIFHRKL